MKAWVNIKATKKHLRVKSHAYVQLFLRSFAWVFTLKAETLNAYRKMPRMKNGNMAEKLQ